MTLSVALTALPLANPVQITGNPAAVATSAVTGAWDTFPDPVGQAAGVWTGKFRDEFTGSSVTVLDSSQGASPGGNVVLSPGGPTWRAWYPDALNTDGGPHSNNAGTELEYYDFTALSLDGVSTLTLTATHDSVHSGLPYTSGMIQSNPSFNFKFGYVEARIKAPASSGAWPAFWMIASAFEWPPEIDIFEDIDTGGTGYSMSNFGTGATVFGDSVSTDITTYHVYGLKWSSGHLTWYRDGVQIANEGTPSSVPNENMYVVVNLAVRNTNSSTITTQVDYVRIWQ